MRQTDAEIGRVTPARIFGMSGLGTLVAVALIIGGAFLLAEIALDAPDTGYRPSRAEILTQCEQIKDNTLLDQCFNAADNARE